MPGRLRRRIAARPAGVGQDARGPALAFAPDAG